MQMIFSTARFSILNNSVFPLFLLSPSFYVYSNLSGFYVRSRTPHMSHIRFASFDISSLRTSSPRTTFGRAQLFRAHALSLRLSASAPLCSLQSNKNQGYQSPASNPHGFSAGCPVCSLAYLLRFTTEKRSARPASSNPKQNNNSIQNNNLKSK